MYEKKLSHDPEKEIAWFFLVCLLFFQVEAAVPAKGLSGKMGLK
jgi:hypothetical protein